MVDTSKVSVPAEVVATSGGDGGVPLGISFNGDPGAAPAGARVRATNLDDQGDTVVTTARDDGSFMLAIPVREGDELRFEAVVGSVRSEPADAFVRMDPGTRLEASPRHACLSLEPGHAIELTGQAGSVLAFVNGCDEAVTLTNPSFRLGLPNFALETALPASVPAGERLELSIVHEAASAGRAEDVLFIDVALGGETIRYPITLSAE